MRITTQLTYRDDAMMKLRQVYFGSVEYDSKRLYEEKVKRQLSKGILFGKLANGGTANVDVVDGEFVFTYRERTEEPCEIIAE